MSEALPEDDRHLREERLVREPLLKGHFLQVVRDTVRLPDGRQATREFVLHPGAVMVVALADDGRLLMERQYRHPMGQVMLEFPAGKRDPDEDSLSCARRELQEETGYTAREWAFAGRHAPTIAYSDEVIDIWFARGLQAGERRLDEGEFLDVFLAEPSELMAACRDGRLIDGKTITGLLWWQQVMNGSWLLEWRDNPAP